MNCPDALQQMQHQQLVTIKSDWNNGNALNHSLT